MKNLLSIFGLALAFGFFSCKDEIEPIPSYLEIEPFEVNAPGGAAWHKLLYAYVYVNNEILGAFSPGKPFPVLAEGEAKILIFPLVNSDGQADKPAIFPFFKRFETTVNLVRGQVTKLKPTTGYETNSKDVWGQKSQFDGSTVIFENLDEDEVVNLSFDTQNAFSGRSARMRVDTAHNIMLIASEWVPDLPVNGADQVWLEMHYRCDAPFDLFLDGRDQPGEEENKPIFKFAPKSDWNKIYFNLTPFVAPLQKKEYRLVLRLDLPTDFNTGKYTMNEAVAQFDNLTLLHF